MGPSHNCAHRGGGARATCWAGGAGGADHVLVAGSTLAPPAAVKWRAGHRFPARLHVEHACCSRRRSCGSLADCVQRAAVQLRGARGTCDMSRGGHARLVLVVILSRPVDGCALLRRCRVCRQGARSCCVCARQMPAAGAAFATLSAQPRCQRHPAPPRRPASPTAWGPACARGGLRRTKIMVPW